MTRAADAIVIGAGIVGAACAWALAREGLRISIIDPNPIGSGATAAGMGHVVVIDEPAGEFALTLHSRRLWDELAPDLPQAVERSVTGTLWVATDQEELDAARAKAARLASAGVRAELLDSRQIEDAEPRLRPGLAGALRVHEDSVVYAPPAARWMIERAVVSGSSLLLGHRVVEVRPGQVTLCTGETRSAGLVVNAAGLGAGSIGAGLPLRARKGHLIITDRYPGYCRHQIVELGYIKNAHGTARESVSFNVQPRPSGQLLVGSSRQFDADDPGVEPRMLSRVIERASSFMPGLAGLNGIRAWAGFRAATPDGLPIIGPHPSTPGVYLAVGHEGLGITTALGTASLLAAHVAGRAPAIDPTPYRPDRFAEIARA